MMVTMKTMEDDLSDNNNVNDYDGNDGDHDTDESLAPSFFPLHRVQILSNGLRAL